MAAGDDGQLITGPWPRIGNGTRPTREYLEARRRLGMPSGVYDDDTGEQLPARPEPVLCEGCAAPMTIITPGSGQRFHPCCEPAEPPP